MSMSDFGTNVANYARGKSWYWYAPLWLIGAFAFISLRQFDMVKGNMPFILLVPYSFDFVLHEFAHLFTAWLPPVVTAAAGSGSELLLGATLVVMAFWQRSYFASMFCLLWFDLTCQSAGQYMADAVPQRLPLVSLGAALSGGDAKHDWHFVFGQLHLLDASEFIGNALRLVGLIAGMFGVLFAVWLLYQMSRAPRWAPTADEAILATSHPQNTKPIPQPVKDDGFTSLPLNINSSNQTTSDEQTNSKT